MPTILLVDDDAQVRQIIRKRLASAGHHVLEADNGSAAMRMYRDARPDVVVTDIMMPDKDGRQLIAELLADDPNVRIVAISGAVEFDVPALLAQASQLGALRTLPKPFTSEQLLGAVDGVLAAPGAAPASAAGPGNNASRRRALIGAAAGVIVLLGLLAWWLLFG